MKLSVIIPVLNEADTINRTLNHLFQQSSQPDEVIVVDGDPEGSTLKSINTNRVKSILSPPGRGIQMNSGAREASGEILLFLHADTLLPEEGLAVILDAMKNRQTDVGAFDLCIDSNNLIFRMIEATASLRSRLTRLPFGDQAIFIRQSVFDLMGGYREIPVMEDLELMKRLKAKKIPVSFLSPGVITSSRRWESEGILRRTLKNWLLILLYHAGITPDRLKRFYRTF